MKAILAVAVMALAGCVSHKAAAPAAAVQPKAVVAKSAVPHANQYHMVVRNGKTLYCSEALATGSHISGDPVCLTAERWQRISDKGQQTLEQIDRSNTPMNEHAGR